MLRMGSLMVYEVCLLEMTPQAYREIRFVHLNLLYLPLIIMLFNQLIN